MVAAANVLPISSMTNQVIYVDYFANQLLPQFSQWLADKPD